MKSASVSQAKNDLSALLDEVRRGETVVITHHGKPIARLEPHRASDLSNDEAVSALIQRGIAHPPKRRLDVKGFLATPVPRLRKGVSASRMVVAERDEGR